jgi:hypothetical protein
MKFQRYRGIIPEITGEDEVLAAARRHGGGGRRSTESWVGLP